MVTSSEPEVAESDWQPVNQEQFYAWHSSVKELLGVGLQIQMTVSVHGTHIFYSGHCGQIGRVFITHGRNQGTYFLRRPESL